MPLLRQGGARALAIRAEFAMRHVRENHRAAPVVQAGWPTRRRWAGADSWQAQEAIAEPKAPPPPPACPDFAPGADCSPIRRLPMVLVPRAGAEVPRAFWTSLAGLSGRRPDPAPTIPASKCRPLPQNHPSDIFSARQPVASADLRNRPPEAASILAGCNLSRRGV